MTSFNIYEYATQAQIDQFVPTFLYIKQHSITGKLYFGKTIRTGKKFERYKGSGTKWTRHIHKHGKEHVIDVWYCLFTDIGSLVETAINLQKIMGVANSTLFYNMKEEQGLTGGGCGRIVSKETREKQQKQMAGKLLSQEHKSKIGKSLTGKIRGQNQKKTEYSRLLCPHCGISGNGPIMLARHFDNCKNIRSSPKWIKANEETITLYKQWRKRAGKYVKAPVKQLTGSSNEELLDYIGNCKKFADDIHQQMVISNSRNSIKIMNHILQKPICLGGLNNRNDSWLKETSKRLSDHWIHSS